MKHLNLEMPPPIKLEVCEALDEAGAEPVKLGLEPYELFALCEVLLAATEHPRIDTKPLVWTQAVRGVLIRQLPAEIAAGLIAREREIHGGN